jgi:hypothetical protein
MSVAGALPERAWAEPTMSSVVHHRGACRTVQLARLAVAAICLTVSLAGCSDSGATTGVGATTPNPPGTATSSAAVSPTAPSLSVSPPSSATPAARSALLPEGWTSASIAVVPSVWHAAGDPTNAFQDGTSPGPYTYQPIPAALATRLAADVNASPIDTRGPRSCPIGLPIAHFIYSYQGHPAVHLTADRDCTDLGFDADNTQLMLTAADLNDLFAAAPSFAATYTALSSQPGR